MRPELALARRVQAFRMRTMPDAPQATPKQWYEFSNQTTDGGSNTDLYIFDEISWWGITAMDLVRELMTIDTDTITVRLNSPGGDVWDGIAIKNALITHRSKVNVIVDGDAASIASVIMLAGETITMMPGSFVMIHQAATFCGGTAGDMRECADLLDLINLNIAEMYAARTGKPVRQFLDAMAVSATNMGTRYTAEDAVAVGLADVVGDGATRTSGKSVVPGQAGGDDGMWDRALTTIAGKIAALGEKVGAEVAAVCSCGPKGYRMADIDGQHTEACTARSDLTPRPVNLPDPVGVMYELVANGNSCDECDDVIAGSPYPEDDLPDVPVHPNCDCELQVQYGAGMKTTTPITATADQAEVEFDAELFRSTMREVFA